MNADIGQLLSTISGEPQEAAAKLIEGVSTRIDNAIASAVANGVQSDDLRALLMYSEQLRMSVDYLSNRVAGLPDPEPLE